MNLKEKSELWLESVRLRNMLLKTRLVIELLEDGKEKINGEYIFDKHYVFSLLDKFLEETHEIVFDASILSPKDSDALFSIWNKCKTSSETIFSDETKSDNLAQTNDDDLSNIAEFIMLSQILKWAENDNEETSISQVISMVFDHVFNSFDSSMFNKHKLPYLNLPSGKITLLDLGGGLVFSDLSEEVKISNVTCKPLHQLLKNLNSSNRSSSNNVAQKAFAIITDVNLHFHKQTASSNVVFESTIMDNNKSDFVFFYSSDAEVSKCLSPELNIKETSRGLMYWNFNPNQNLLFEKINYLAPALFK